MKLPRYGYRCYRDCHPDTAPTFVYPRNPAPSDLARLCKEYPRVVRFKRKILEERNL